MTIPVTMMEVLKKQTLNQGFECFAWRELRSRSQRREETVSEEAGLFFPEDAWDSASLCCWILPFSWLTRDGSDIYVKEAGETRHDWRSMFYILDRHAVSLERRRIKKCTKRVGTNVSETLAKQSAAGNTCCSRDSHSLTLQEQWGKHFWRTDVKIQWVLEFLRKTSYKRSNCLSHKNETSKNYERKFFIEEK